VVASPSDRRRLLVAAFCAVAAITSSIGCQHALAAAIPGCHPAWPVVAHRAGGAIAQLPADAALPVACGVETGYASSESTIAVTGGGALIYSPAQTENSMARSLDGGATWSLTLPADEQPTSFWNTVDPYVIADRRTGRAFWTHATGPVRNEGGLPQGSGFYLAAASGFQVFTSSNDGRSWTTADYSTAPTGDWEKLSVGPAPPASSGAAQPSGYPDIVYLCANSPFEVSGPGRLCYKSLDGGTTFAPAGFVSPSPSQPQDVCSPLNFNAAVVDKQGAIYTPADCEQSAYVVISHDEGASDTWVSLKGAPTSGPAAGGLVWLAIDDADNLYALWNANGKLYLTASRDHAQSWSTPMSVGAPGVQSIQRPGFAAGAPGHVAITYYASRDPSAQMLSAYITQTEDALDPQPLFYSAPINDPTQPIFHDYGLTGPSPRLDFTGGAFDSSGTTFWAGVVKQLGQPDSNRNIATTGYVGRLAFVPSTPAGFATSISGITQPGAAALAGGSAKQRTCLPAQRLTFAINRVPGGRVVRVAVRVNRRLLLVHRGRNINSVSFARPRGRQLVIEIVTTNNGGGRVITLRTFRGCTHTRVTGRVHRRPAP
jgi:hypothetical protein